ncbi:carboxymuconolactone decarboxylase family protein [Cellulomonas sp. ICMP 17802]|uniref:carboxymuconolactone decarboxylase family protein n=1 Tax=Cellulomonas sp. ICMP 17802 TaxID=3239199 RepID=UPI00351AD678
MTRVPRLDPASLDEAQRAVYDAVTGGPRAQGPALFRLVDDAGALEGPFNAFLLQPGVGMALQELGAAVRYRTTFSDREREIAILVVAVHRDSAFEWYAHEAVGRHAGLTDAELQALREHDYDVLTSPSERVVARSTHQLLDSGDLDDEAFAQATDVLGLPQVFELLTLVGYYDTLALQLRVLRVAAPPH